MIAEAYAAFPNEGCGFLGGTGDDGTLFVRCENVAGSSRTFEMGIDQVKAERQIEEAGGEILAVVHSHTHTDAYPSPTDVEKSAIVPGWRWVIVSLKHAEPVVRSYTIESGQVCEEEIVLADQ
jgi:[CysO sulfur-carrier protein]-S-L-cysteine hydrolase